jgi:plastocyanin
MKKIYMYVALIICTVNASATIWQVTVNDNSFSPSTLPNVVCGDTVGWILSPTATLPHTATSTTIPAGAPTFNGNVAPVYAYVVPNFAGVYNYKCAFHLFTGSFTVTCSVGIDEHQQNISSLVYPNPFSSQFTLENRDADAVKIMNVTGQVVAAKNLSGSKAEINLAELAPGVYFLTTWKEGILRQTEKIIKSK